MSVESVPVLYGGYAEVMFYLVQRLVSDFSKFDDGDGDLANTAQGRADLG